MNREQQLLNDWLSVAGIDPRPAELLHGGDEMYAWSEKLGLPKERQLLDYMRGGQEPVLMLRHLAAKAQRPLGQMRRVLEFACGHGRCTRMLVGDISPDTLWCSDVQADGVEFVREVFGVHGVVSETDPEQLQLPGPFDLIWVGSLFSHFPRERFLAFLSRLMNVLSPGGMLVFSTHGMHVVPEMHKDDPDFCFIPENESEVLDAADYGTTFVRPGRVRELAQEIGADHLYSIECDLWSVQDVHVASRAEIPGLNSWSNTPFVRGSIDRVEVGPGDKAWIGGWLKSPAALGLPKQVELVIDAKAAYEVQVGNVQKLTLGESAAFIHAEWYLEGSTAGLAPGPHTACALATDSAGGKHCFDATLFDIH